jgi:hypothetical protein
VERKVHEEIDICDLFAQVAPSLDPPAVVQRTVARGELPALVVVHDAEDYWLVGDGVGDPNLPDACGIYQPLPRSRPGSNGRGDDGAATGVCGATGLR